jgi:hypothetical protein
MHISDRHGRVDSLLLVDSNMRPRSSSCSGGEYRIATGIIHTPWFASWRLRRRTTSRHEPTLEGHHPESTESLAEMSLPQHSCHCRRHVACRISPAAICHGALTMGVKQKRWSRDWTVSPVFARPVSFPERLRFLHRELVLCSTALPAATGRVLRTISDRSVSLH